MKNDYKKEKALKKIKELIEKNFNNSDVFVTVNYESYNQVHQLKK